MMEPYGLMKIKIDSSNALRSKIRKKTIRALIF